MKSITLPDGTKKYLKEEMVEKLASRSIAIDTETCSYEVAAAIVKLVFPKDTEELKQKLFDVYPYLEAYRFSETEWNLVRNTTLRIVNVADFFEDNTVLPEQEMKPEEDADKKIKVTFGMQPNHLEVIEAELAKYNDLPNAGMLYSYHLWQDVGKKIGWDALTIALKYFERKSKTPTPIPDEYKKVMEQMREALADIVLAYKSTLSFANSMDEFMTSKERKESIENDSDILACDNALAAYENLITNK